MISKQIGQSTEYYLLYDILKQLERVTQVMSMISVSGGSGWAVSGATAITTPTITGNWTLAGNQTISGLSSYLNFDKSVAASSNYFEKIVTRDSATYGTFNRTISDSSTNGATGQNNNVMMWGYNNTPGGGREIVGKAEFHLALESSYNGISNDDFEFHVQSTAVDGTVSRHWTMNVRKDNGQSVQTFTTNSVEWRTLTAGTSYFSLADKQFTLSSISGGRTARLVISDATGLLSLEPYSGTFSAGLSLSNFTVGSIPAATTIGISGTSTAANLTFAGLSTNTITLPSNLPLLIQTSGGKGIQISGATTQRIISATSGGIERSYYQNDFGTGEIRLWGDNSWYHTIYASAVEQFRVQSTSVRANSMYIGAVGTAPSSKLHLAAGTSTANTAPLQFTSGTLETTARAGVIEYDGTNFYGTRTGTTRGTLIQSDAVNSVSPTAPNRTITVNIGGTTYYLHAKTTND